MLLKQLDIINHLKDEDDDTSQNSKSEFKEKMKAAEGQCSNHHGSFVQTVFSDQLMKLLVHKQHEPSGNKLYQNSFILGGAGDQTDSYNTFDGKISRTHKKEFSIQYSISIF